MFRLIDRYVFKEIAAPSLLGLLVYTAIFIVNNFFKLADAWVKGTMTMGDVGRALLYYLPSVLAMTMPMSVLLGVLIGFSRLSADSEITALRTTGVSYFRLLVPTLAFAAVAWGATTIVYMKLVPPANTRAVELTSSAARRVDINREVRPGVWTPLMDGVPGQEAAIFARGLDQTNVDEPWLTDVDIVMIDRQAGEARHHQAQRARIDRVITGEETGRFRFVFEGLRTILWKPDATGEAPKITEAARAEQLGPQRRMHGGRAPTTSRRIDKGVRLQTLTELKQTLRDLDEMDRIDQLKKVDPDEAARRQAAAKVPLVPQVRERTKRLAQMEIHKKFAIPVACIVFALAGMPLGISTRRGGRPASFAISIAVIILWWLIYNAGETWCLAGRLSPSTGAWLPDLVIGIVAVHALLAQRRQQAVGLYRALRDGLLLGALVLGLLTVVFVWEKQQSPAAPSLPPWAPVGALALLLAHVVFVRKRDALSRTLADVSEAFRRPRADVALETAPEEEPGTSQPLLQPVEPPPPSPGTQPVPDPKDEHRWIRRHRLEKIRGALVFSFLAMLVFSAVEAFQHEGGPMAGVRDLLTSWEPLALLVLALGCVALQAAGVRVVSTLDWWVSRDLVRHFSLVLGSMVVMYVVFQYLELADTVLANKVRATVVLDYFWHLLPRMLTDTIPFAAMGAVVVTFGMMAKFNETTAVRCGGVSVWRVVMPGVLLGLLLSCFSFVLRDYVLPRSNQTADDLRRQMQGAPPLRRANMRGFLMGSDGHSLYQFRSVNANETGDRGIQSQITGLTVLQQGPDGRVNDLWSATDAVWQGDQWVLRNGWHAVIDSSNRVRVDAFDAQALASLERPEYFAAIRRDPNQMAFAEFSRYVEEQKAAGFPTAALRVSLHAKLAHPAGALILVLVGLPFAFTGGRRGALYGVGIALMLAVVYLASVAFFTAMGSAEYLPPVAAAWAPNGIFALAGVYMLLHVRT